MQLSSFEYQGKKCIGVRKNNEIVVIESVTMKQLVVMGDKGLDVANKVLKNISHATVVGFDSIRWLPPITNPGKICGVAMNNSASNERKISAPDHPAFFLKPTSCLIGHKEPILIRPYYAVPIPSLS